MACVDRHGAYGLVLTLVMFFNTANGAAQTTISCGESRGIVGQPQVLSCSISGSIENDIYWYRYNATYSENIVLCTKTGPDNVGSCVAPPNLRSKYNVSTEAQPPRNPSFTIISVTAEDLEVSWLCVDNIKFPDRSSIPDSSTCSLKQGVPKTTVSCGGSRGVVGQPQTLTCNVVGAVTTNIYWYRYNDTYSKDVINCFKTGGDVGRCFAENNLLYNVSSQHQQPKQQVFTIRSVTQEDLQVSWLCVDNNSFPERASIQAESTCRLDQETTTILPTTTTGGPPPDRECSLVGGVAFIGDCVVGVVVFLVMICVVNKVLNTLLKIAVFVIFALVSGILGVGSYVACINGISTGGIIGINIGVMLPVLIITIIVVKFSC